MLAWKVDFGYLPRNFNISTLTSIDQITFTDFDRPFGFLTTNTPFGSNVIFGKTVDFEEWKDDAISSLQVQLGDDYFRTYGMVSSIGDRGRSENFNYILGSYFLASPNIMSILESSTDINESIIPVIHFKGLHKLLIITELVNIRYYVYNDIDPLILLSSQSSTSLLPYSSPRISISYYRNVAGFWCINNYDPNKNVVDQDIFIRGINMYTSSTQNSMLYEISNSVVRLNSDPIFSKIFENYVDPDYDIQPYDPIPPSGEDGGNGSFDDSSDLIPDSSLPTLSSANTGFTRIYNPTLSQVQQLAQYLWTDETLIETLWNKVKQYFEDPMQAIIGFNLVPVPVPDAGTKNFALMYIDTGVSMNVAASQFVDRDCGTLKIEPYYGSALDYAPHTKISIFLPFIGTVQLNTDEIMGRTLQVKYRVDICSGSCVAKVAVDGNFIYQFSGHCAIPIPISSSDFSSYVGSAISVAKLGITAAVGAATGGAGLFASAAAQQTGNAVSTMTETTTARNPDTGRQITTGTRTVEVSTPVQSTGASFSGISPQNVSNTVGEVMASKPFVEHSGSFSGNTGYLGIRRPFLIIERPNLCLPENFQNYNGYPCMITLPLSECTGFTAVQQIHLEGVTATNPEQAEIMELLKGGVIF